MHSFIFDSYNVDLTGRTLFFRYSLDGYSFIERIELKEPLSKELNQDLLNAILFNLHLALGISYWKLLCPTHIEVRSGKLSKKQAAFWDTIYTEGLGEFYYRNNIDFRGRVSFPYADKPSFVPDGASLTVGKRQLVGIGGGKDSALTWEMMKKKKIDATGLVIETQKKFGMVDNLAKIGNIPLIHVSRTVDPQIAVLSKQPGFYHGHVPISMIYAWIGMLVCVANGFQSFVASNEKSAEEGNIEYLGAQINHQWSKTMRFEKLFSAYVKQFISPDLKYYSPLRKLTELEIIGQFVKYPKYFPFVSSCNRNFSTTHPLVEKLWCGECAKCAFAFLLFAAHLPKEQVVTMFGKNMFQDERLIGLFRDLEGRGGMKPFDCVGTFEEAQEALAMINKKGEFKNDVVFEALMK